MEVRTLPTTPFLTHTLEFDMKKILLFFVLFGFINYSVAGNDPYLSATETYDATKKLTNTSKITWITVDEKDVLKTCREKGVELKSKTNFIDPRACSFWTKDFCIVITSKTPILGSLEHEIRHCFQGHWH